MQCLKCGATNCKWKSVAAVSQSANTALEPRGVQRTGMASGLLRQLVAP